MPKCPSCNEDFSPDLDRCPACGARVDDPVKSLADEIASLLAQGNKMEAIKLFRERTDVGLKEAKDAVEAMERDKSPLSPDRLESKQEQEVLVLLREGKKMEAIKLYRQATGAGMKDSREAVEALAVEHGIESAGKVGCLGVFLVMILGVVAWIVSVA